jgi:hypothetical protein
MQFAMQVGWISGTTQKIDTGRNRGLANEAKDFTMSGP